MIIIFALSVISESRSAVSNSLWPHGLYSPPGQNTLVGSFPFSRGSSQPTDGTQVSCIAGWFFLPVETQQKPKNTGVGSLSLLQQIFLIQESNEGLLHCRQILYQLSYQGSPIQIEACKIYLSMLLLNTLFWLSLLRCTWQEKARITDDEVSRKETGSVLNLTNPTKYNITIQH